MKTNKREKLMKNIAAVALILGVFSPLAQAAISEQDGISQADLTRVVQDLEIQQNGNSITIAGIMPKFCAEGAMMAYDYKEGKHLATIRMPNYPKCFEDFKALPDSEKRAQKVDAADVFPIIKLKDLTGNLFLRYYKEGSKAATDRIQDEALNNQKGKAIAFESSETAKANEEARLQKEADKEEQKLADEAEKARVASLDALQAKVAKYCKDGDYVGLGQEITNASELIGDVTEMLEKVSNSQKDKIKKDLNSATTAEEASAAHEAYLEAALTNGWDEDELKQTYIDKRFELLTTAAEDAKSGESKLSEVDAQIRAWMSDLRGFDGKVYRKKKETFAELYAELGTHAMNKNDSANAEKYLDKAKNLSDVDGQIKIDGALSKLYAEQFKACVQKDPTKMEACEKKFMSKAKNRADSIERALAGKGGEDSAEQLAAFQAEKIQTFGGGMSTTYNGFGTMSQVPGAVEQFKKQAYQEYMQKQQMQQMQKMYGQQMPGAAPAAAGTNFLGIR